MRYSEKYRAAARRARGKRRARAKREKREVYGESPLLLMFGQTAGKAEMMKTMAEMHMRGLFRPRESL